MPKRARGSTTRPGQRARTQRTTAPKPTESTAPQPKPTGLTSDEEARAAALEAQIVAEERAAETQAKQNRDRAKRDPEPVARGGSISVRASQEYAYVMRDVRRIVTIGGGLIVLLIVFWAIVESTGMGPF